MSNRQLTRARLLLAMGCGSLKVRPARAFMAILDVALLLPATAAAATFTWGFNYVTVSTNVGSCPSTVPLGRVCSPWDTWTSNYLDKRNAATVCFGWANNSMASCNGYSGNLTVATTPGQFGMGGTLKSQVNNYSQSAYLYTAAYN